MSVISAEEGEPKGPKPWWQRIEDGFVVTVLSVMVVLPVGSVIARWTTGQAVSGANLWVQALNLWIAFAGGALAARAGTHLSLSTGQIFGLKGRTKDIVAGFTSAVGTAVTALLAYASVEVVKAETASTMTLAGGVPMWVIQLAMPVGFLLMAVRLAWNGNRTTAGRVAALIAVIMACALALLPPGSRSPAVWAGGILLSAAVALGAALYTAMGGMAMLLFYGSPIPVSISAVPAETFRIVADPTLASVPLFTLAGYLLAEGSASVRLVRVFQACFGWLPGGVAAAAILVSAFFTTFTGASGVTILALGGLLLPALRAAGYDERFSVGLIAAAGSIGLLFPPSLPVILYGVASHVPITDLFIGGLVPGILLVAMLVGYSVIIALKNRKTGGDGTDHQKMGAGERLKEIRRALWESKFEVALPLLVLVGIFGGFLTIFEAAAFTAAYAYVVEVIIHRDLHPIRDVPRVFVECATLIGGVMIILGVALGFTSFLVDAEVPLAVRDWVQSHVANRLMFILLLNVVLLGVGCLMDIYSAIMVVVPLIVPVALFFHIHPVHLGILFLANLELGYLTPPVGLNLFLASFRFKVPLTRVYRDALPFLGLMTVAVLIIAYVPVATTWGLDEASAEATPNFFEDELAEPVAAPPGGLSPEELQRMLEEGDEEEEAPVGPPKLDMNSIFDELEEDAAPEPGGE